MYLACTHKVFHINCIICPQFVCKKTFCTYVVGLKKNIHALLPLQATKTHRNTREEGFIQDRVIVL